MGKDNQPARGPIFPWRKKRSGEIPHAPKPAPVASPDVFAALHNPPTEPVSDVFAQLHAAQKPFAETSHPETQGTPAFYEQNTHEVKQRLEAWGFGEPIQMLTPEGLDREKYIAFVRRELFGEQYEQGIPPEGLPEKMGEVTIPVELRTRLPQVALLGTSVNVGLGHVREEITMENLIQVAGGAVKRMFLGGPEDVIPATRLTNTLFHDVSPDRIVRAICWQYQQESKRVAFNQGMSPVEADGKDPDPEATKALASVMRLVRPRQFQKDPDAALRSIVTPQEHQTKQEIDNDARKLSFVFGRNLRMAIENFIQEHPDKKDVLFFSTHPMPSRIFHYLRKAFRKNIGAANHQPDIVQVLYGYTDDPPTSVESDLAQEKWATILKLPLGTRPEGVIDLPGYVAPLAYFKRNSLHEARQNALRSETPLTVLAVASGVAPAQLGAFTEFIQSGKEQLKDGKMRLVVQCGSEDGDGLIVYERLKKIVGDNDLQNNVVLHVAPTQVAAVDFLEAAMWAPVPLVVDVKPAEVARTIYALNGPYSPTGFVGDHESWNLIQMLKDNPEIVTFLPDAAARCYRELERILPNDVLVNNGNGRGKTFIEEILAQVKNRTAKDMDDFIAKTSAYILSSQKTESDPAAMFLLLEDMLHRKDKQQNGQQRRFRMKRKSQHDQAVTPQQSPIPQPIPALAEE